MPRSPLLMSADDSALLVVDMQIKLLAAIPDADRLIRNAGRLLQGAKLFSVPTAGTEQYPKGLGPTVPELSGLLGKIPDKLDFSCVACHQIFQEWSQQGVRKILLAGIESHVCVLQTALDLLTAQFDVFVAVDAVGSRHAMDQEIALRRMESSGATLVTTEMALFEWCQSAGTDAFKTLSGLVK